MEQVKMKTPAKRASIPLGPGWSIALRRDEVFPDDPGNGTPAMVHGPFGKSSTYWCALDTGCVVGPDSWEEFDIPRNVYRRMEEAEQQVLDYLKQVEEWLALKKEGEEL